MSKLSDADLRFVRENLPPPHNTEERYRDYFLPKIQKHRTLCTPIIAKVKKILEPLKEQFGHRFFYRIDETNTSKSPESIIDKIRRGELKNPEDEITIQNFAEKMTDLARFRIVCNFLGDVEKISRALRESQELNEHFAIDVKDTTKLRPKERKSGERSIKLIMKYKKSPDLFLEIQIMTQLAEAWDKKDHFLVYEIRRRAPEKDDENFPDFLDAKMHAMSELLNVADNYFDDLRQTRESALDDKETS